MRYVRIKRILAGAVAFAVSAGACISPVSAAADDSDIIPVLMEAGGRIEISGEEAVDLSSISEFPKEYVYSAVIYDPEGNEISEDAEWSYTTTARSGKIRFNGDTGVMTIPEDAVFQTVTVNTEYLDEEWEASGSFKVYIGDGTVPSPVPTKQPEPEPTEEPYEYPSEIGLSAVAKLRSNNTSGNYNFVYPKTAPPVNREVGMTAGAQIAAILRFDMGEAAEAEDYISKITLSLERYGGGSAPLGVWLYDDAPDIVRNDGKVWRETIWTEFESQSDIKNNVSIALGINDFSSGEFSAANGASAKTPLAYASAVSNKYEIELMGDALYKALEYAGNNGNMLDLVLMNRGLTAASSMTQVCFIDEDEHKGAQLSVEYSIPERIEIIGGRSIDLSSPDVYTYTATIYDRNGNVIDDEPQWSYKSNVKEGKARFNTDTGELTVTDETASQTLTITAEYGYVTESIDVLLVDELIPTSMTLEGADSINNYISIKERQYSYRAVVIDQLENEMVNPPVIWSSQTTAAENKAFIDSGSGVLTVPAGAVNQTVTIIAKCGELTETKTVVISKTILDFPESFTAEHTLKVRGTDNTYHLDTENVEIGMYATSPAILSFDLSKIMEAEDAITKLQLTVYKERGTSIALGLWEYYDPSDIERTDGKEWSDVDWTDNSNLAAVKSNFSLIFGMDDFTKASRDTSNNYAPGRTSYIDPITTANISEGAYAFEITGDALKKVVEHAKENGGFAEFALCSADLDLRANTIYLYAKGVYATSNEQYLPVLNVAYELPSTPRRVEISGEDTLYINSRVSSYTTQYSAAVYDQNDELYEDQEVIWSADMGDTANVDFNTQKGILTIRSSSGEGTVTITAKSAFASGSKKITVKKIPENFRNGSFEDTDDSYLAEGWTPNVPVYKVNFDETDYYTDKWNDAKTNDAGTLFTRTQQYELSEGDDETTDIRGTSGINSVVKMQYTASITDEEATTLMNSASQTIGVNNAKDGAYMTVGYEIPYYYMLDYYLSGEAERMLSNQGIYLGLEFRNKADTAYLSSAATGNSYVPFVTGQWRTFTGTFTSGNANQINGNTRVNIGMSGMKGTGYIDYFRLVPKGIDTQTAYRGQNSMYVPNTLTWDSDVFSVEGGAYYTYYVSVKPETSIVEGRVTYTFMDNNYNPMGEFIVSTDKGGWSDADENGWKTIQGETAIPSGATICRVTISNPDGEGGIWFDNLVFTKTAEAKADTVRITGGSSEGVIPVSGENSYQYTAAVYDQYNNVMSSDVSWSVTSAGGVSITSGGILKVASSASEGTVTVTVSRDGKTASRTVRIIKPGEVSEPVSENEYGLNGSFTANDGTDPYGWTNSGRDVISYTFDTGLEGWKSSRTDYGASVEGELLWDEEQNHTSGDGSGAMLIYNTSYNMPISTIPNDVRIQGGMPYNFEMYFKQSEISDDSTVRAHLRYFNSTGGTIAENPNMLRYYPEEYKKNIDSDGWQKWSGTEVVPTNASTVRLDVRYRGGLNNDNGYAWFDDIKVSKVSKLDKDNTYNGNPSLMLVGYNEDVTTAGKEYGERWVSDKITNISQGNSYEYSAMLQTYEADSGAYMSFTFYDENGNELSTVKSDKVTGTTNTWTLLSGSVTAPQGAVSVCAAYNIDGTGTAWASGISFGKMSDQGVSGIRISGASSVKIPSGGNNASNYTVDCINSSGNTVGAADTVITASNLPSGVTFENGILTVSPDAKTGNVTLTATYNGFSNTKTVSISASSSETSSGGGGGGGGGGSSGGSGGGSSGGSGGTTSTMTKTTTTTSENTSPMGHVVDRGSIAVSAQGSQNVSDASGAIPTLLQAPSINYFTGGDGEEIFTDIDNVPWAKNAIEALYKAGVVAGKDDKIFAPNDNVTRAEFLTMLVKAFRLTSDNNENSFADVNEGDWYFEPVNTAVGKGIVSGISDDYFGAAEDIKRQDMAVLCRRLWDSLGREMTGPYRVSFTDFDEVSDYALDAVTNLAEAGIINGMDTGEFKPLDSATRAQAAVIIYGMAVKYDE